MTVETAGTEPIYYDPYDYGIDINPHPVWHRMREEQPLHWNEQYGFWSLSRFEDVWAAYHDTETFSSSHGVQPEQLDNPADSKMMIFMDPPEHDSLRQIVSRAFTPRRMAALEDSIGTLAAQYLDQFTGTDGFDYIAEFGALLPPMVIGELLGVPAADRDAIRLHVDDMLHIEDGAVGGGEKFLAAGLAVYQYYAAMVAERRKAPQDDLVSALLEAELDDGGMHRKLTEEEIMAFLMLLNGAGIETVARLLSWAAVTLARNPGQREILVADPSLVPNAIEELLRYEAPSPVNGRWVTQPVTLHGVTIPAGSKMLLLNGSANRDRREFEDPDRFDVRRTISRHIAFGFGTHFCLGAALARLEGRVALAATLARFPRWEIDEKELVMVRTSTVRGFSSVPVHLG